LNAVFFYNKLARFVGETNLHLRDQTVNYGTAFQPNIAIHLNEYTVSEQFTQINNTV